MSLYEWFTLRNLGLVAGKIERWKLDGMEVTCISIVPIHVCLGLLWKWVVTHGRSCIFFQIQSHWSNCKKRWQ
jgi:hypothetical protein